MKRLINWFKSLLPFEIAVYIFIFIAVIAIISVTVFFIQVELPIRQKIIETVLS